MVTIELIARVCHEANRALQIFGGESDISPAFDDAPDWQRESAIAGVRAALDGCTPKELHDAWCVNKRSNGWKFGPEKDAEAKTHPCLVPYDQLPEYQRLKDYVFKAIVDSFPTVEEQPES